MWTKLYEDKWGKGKVMMIKIHLSKLAMLYAFQAVSQNSQSYSAPFA